MATSNRNLNTAKSGKNDEFYTKLYDVVMGLNPIRSYFRNKDILCNCADYNRAFHQYFAMNFVPFGLRSLTVFSRTGKVIRYYGKKKEVIFNGCSGSFTDLRYLTDNTIVVTNPPFSLITDFILLHHKKNIQFVILAPMNATGYKPIVPLIVNNTLQARYYIAREYRVPYTTDRHYSDGFYQRIGNTIWLYHKFPPVPVSPIPNHPPQNPTPLDNYNALFCNAIMDIKNPLLPKDTPLAVPVTYICYHNPSEYEIIDYLHTPILRGKRMFKRWIIRKI